MKAKALRLLVFIFFSAHLFSCQQETARMKSKWSAQWIGPSSPYERSDVDWIKGASWIWSHYVRGNPASIAPEKPLYFRKTFELSNASIESAQIRITADNSYVLFVNGEEVGEDAQLSSPEKYDVSTMLKEGTNVIAVHARNLQMHHTNRRGSGNSSAGLLAKLDFVYENGQRIVITSDASWKMTDKLEEDWHKLDFDDKSWGKAIDTGRKGLEEWNGYDTRENSWYRFRKKFDLTEIPKEANAKIAVDSKYWLWINGELAVFEGGLKRGPNPQDTYYDEIELSKYLQTGENTIAVLVWYWGRSGFSHHSSGSPGLLFEMIVDDEKILSDASWSMSIHPSYGFTDAPHPNYRLSEHNIYYDAQKGDEAWLLNGYDDSSWPAATELGIPPTRPWNNLVVRPIPLWFNSGLLEYEKIDKISGVAEVDTFLCYLPYNAHITSFLKVAAPAGEKIDMRMDNYVGGSENSIRSEYVTKAGEQEFEALAWMNGHVVKYAVPKSVEIKELRYRETGYNAAVLGMFKSDDEFYNKLWQKSLRTLQVCMRDNYYDCPDRERAQWWGDAVIEIGQTFYTLDRVSDSLTRKAMRELVDWKKDESTLYSPIPGNWQAELPGQMLMSIGKYGFWNYFMHTADTSMIEYVYPHVKAYLKLWKMDERGLVIHRSGDWDWGDWGSNKDRPLLDNCYYTLALQAAIEMAKLTRNLEDVDFYQQRISSIKNGFNTHFWNGEAYRSPEYKGETDDRGQGLAVLASIADADKYEAIAQVLQRQYYASPYTERYVLEALFIMGKAEQGLERMKKRFGIMVDSPYSTLYEGWGVGNKGYGGGTINHSWSGGPLLVLSERVAGVRPLLPGYDRFSVLPQTGGLNNISTKVPSIKGQIVLDIRDDGDNISLNVGVPEKSICLAGIPFGEDKVIKQIQLDDILIFKDGKIIGDDTEFEKRNSHFCFEVGTGAHKIQATYF